MSQPKLADAARTGFAAAKSYDQHRPGYVQEAVKAFLQVLEIEGVERVRVLDLGAGTGKFTEILAARPEGYDITAVEPHEEMREQLSNKKLDSVHIVPGTGEDLQGIPTESFAAVTVAQAFHWMANMATLKEIHRVLQPTGVVGLIWNIEDYNSPLGWEIHEGWESKLRDVIWSYDDNHPRFRHEKWKEVFDEQNSGNPLTSDPLFGLPLGEKSIDQTVYLPKKDIWSRYRTLSQIAILEGNELQRVEKIFWDAIDSPETETDDQGRVAVHLRTYFAWASKIPNVPLGNTI